MRKRPGKRRQAGSSGWPKVKTLRRLPEPRATARAVAQPRRADANVARADTRRPVNAALKSLPIGQSSGVIASPESFHVVRVEGRRAAGPASFEEVQDKIRPCLRMPSIKRRGSPISPSSDVAHSSPCTKWKKPRSLAPKTASESAAKA